MADPDEITFTQENNVSKLLTYLKEAIKEHRVSGGKRNASIACDRIGELYTFLIEENATLLRRDTDRLSEILRLEKENLLLKSNPLPFSSPIAPRSHITSYASSVKGPEKHSVILELLICNASQNHREKKVAKSEVRKIVSDLGKKIQDSGKSFSVLNAMPGRNGKIILELSSQEDAKKAVQVFEEKSELTRYNPKQPIKKRPRMIVRNLSCSKDIEQVRTCLLNSNTIIAELESRGEFFKVITLLRKSEDSSDVVLEVSPKIRNQIKNQRGVKTGFMINDCTDYIYLQRCGRCCLYGHKSAECKGTTVCSYCMGNHEYGTCDSNRPYYHSCHVKGLKADGHTSYDIKKCPTAQKLKEIWQNRIDYSYD